MEIDGLFVLIAAAFLASSSTKKRHPGPKRRVACSYLVTLKAKLPAPL